MTAGVEASDHRAVLRPVDGPATLLDGLIAEVGQWTVLDGHQWPFDRDRGTEPAWGESVRRPRSLPIGPRPPLAVNDRISPAICDVVAAWRAADRELAGLVEDEPEWNRVRAEIIGLRALHHRLFEARLGSRG